MLYTPTKAYWCCLNPRERQMITLLIGAFAVNPEYVTQATYTVFTFLTGRAAFILMNAQFLITYGLTEGEIINEDGLPVPVVFFDLEQWSEFYAFSLTDDFICLAPCKFLTFPL